MANFSKCLHVRHTAPQLFDLVADVERYSEFVPWVVEARVIGRDGHVMSVDMAMGTRILCWRFSTVAELDRPRLIKINGIGAMFDRFEQRWVFEPATKGGTVVEYAVVVELRSSVLAGLVGATIGSGAQSVVAAFVRRADELYGASPNDEAASRRSRRHQDPGAPF